MANGGYRMFDRVLILAIGIGGGHFRAAQALRTVFYRLGAAREVRIADMMTYTNKLFRRLFLKAYFDVVDKAPQLYGWLYDHYDDKPGDDHGHTNLFERLNAKPVLRLLDECRPDLVISTHVLPAGITSWLQGQGHITVPHAIVVTDFDIHAMWLCEHYEHYFVALEETKLHLEALGIPAEKVSATGIPIDPAFGEPRDRVRTCRQLGLDPERTTILVASGSWGLGPVDRIVQSLQGLRHKAQVVAICGKNEQLKAEVDQVVQQWPADSLVKVVCLGWTDEMPAWMSAADLVAGKTGGMTTSEALAKGLPFLIVNPIQGQEERNADHLLEEGAAIRCNNLPVLAYKVDRLLGDPKRLAHMRANARRLGRPHAAFEIVRTLVKAG